MPKFLTISSVIAFGLLLNGCNSSSSSGQSDINLTKNDLNKSNELNSSKSTTESENEDSDSEITSGEIFDLASNDVVGNSDKNY